MVLIDFVFPWLLEKYFVIVCECVILVFAIFIEWKFLEDFKVKKNKQMAEMLLKDVNIVVCK